MEKKLIDRARNSGIAEVEKQIVTGSNLVNVITLTLENVLNKNGKIKSNFRFLQHNIDWHCLLKEHCRASGWLF